MIGIKKNNFLEINNIKNRNLICLDFDDCIIEWNRCQNKEISECKNELLTSLQRNVKIIDKFCKKKKYDVFITSSWSDCFEKNLQPIKECFDNLMIEIWNVIKTLPIIGYDPFGDREIAMDVLLDNGNKIICIDDLDLGPHFEYAGEQFIMLNVVNGKNLEKLLEL